MASETQTLSHSELRKKTPTKNHDRRAFISCKMSKKIPEFAIYNFKGSWQVEKTWYLKYPIVDISRFDYGETVLIKMLSNSKETIYVCKVMLFGGNISLCY